MCSYWLFIVFVFADTDITGKEGVEYFENIWKVKIRESRYCLCSGN